MTDLSTQAHTLALHSLTDFDGCDLAQLRNAEGLRSVLIQAIRDAGGTYINDIFHQFSPHGLSGIIIIAESHVALHTWPERAFAALDVFSCSAAFKLDLIAERLGEFLQAKAIRHRQEQRQTLSILTDGPC